MVVGEEFLIGKGIEALLTWFKKKKTNKEIVHEILMSLKISLNNLTLHMDLSKEHGSIKYSKLQCYLPNDIELINQLLIKFQLNLDNTLYDEIMNFVKYLVSYNETINSLCMGMGSVLREKENKIRDSVNQYITKINELLKEVE